MDTVETITQLTNGLTRVEGIALLALLEHLGLDLSSTQPATNGTLHNGRTWTRAQRLAHSKRMKAFWRARKRTGK